MQLTRQRAVVASYRTEQGRVGFEIARHQSGQRQGGAVEPQRAVGAGAVRQAGAQVLGDVDAAELAAPGLAIALPGRVRLEVDAPRQARLATWRRPAEDDPTSAVLVSTVVSSQDSGSLEVRPRRAASLTGRLQMAVQQRSTATPARPGASEQSAYAA